MKRPWVVIALLFAQGILLASKIKISLSLAYGLLVIFFILSLLSFKRRLRFNIFVSGLIFMLGSVCLKNSKNLPQCHISRYIYYKDAQVYILKGYVDSQPISKNNKTSFIFKTQAMQSGNLNYSCCGKVLVYLKGKKDFPYGEGLILRGNLYRPFTKGRAHKQRYGDYLYNQDIYLMMTVKTPQDTLRLKHNQGFIPKRLALWLKERAEKLIFQHTSFLTAAILEAMVLGEKNDIPWNVFNAMMKSGTVHILVVSGFNVGIVSFMLMLFLKLMRLPRRVRFSLTIFFLLIYCLLTGASTPVVRATVMAIVFISGFLLKRETDIYNSCAIAALFILAVNPKQLFDIGFQLSFASVIALIYLYPKMRSLLHIESLKIKSLRFLLDSCLVSFSAWLGTLGFIAYYFKIFSPITVVANIFIVPLATLITLCGFSLILISLILPGLAPFFASTCELLVVSLLKINAFLLKLPCAYFYLS